MDDLRSCPFCGSAAKVSHLDYKNNTSDARMIRCSSDNDCSTLEEHSVEVWNTRPIEDALRAELASMKEVVRAADDMRARSSTYRGLTQSMDRYDAARAKVDVHD